MTCKNCTAPIKETDNFCANCGQHLRTNELSTSPLKILSTKEQETYHTALKRLEKRINLEPTGEQESQYLFWTGLGLAGFWIFNQLVAHSVPSDLLSKIYAVLVTLEAALPLVLSFVVRSLVHKTVLRIVGGTLILVFAYQYFL